MDKIKIAEEEAINDLKEANRKYKYDKEILHDECDGILLGFLEEIGCTEIVKTYNELSNGFHYS